MIKEPGTHTHWIGDDMMVQVKITPRHWWQFFDSDFYMRVVYCGIEVFWTFERDEAQGFMSEFIQGMDDKRAYLKHKEASDADAD